MASLATAVQKEVDKLRRKIARRDLMLRKLQGPEPRQVHSLLTGTSFQTALEASLDLEDPA